MTTTAPAVVPRGPGRLRTFLVTFRAVLTRELRWRMRGRRVYLVATVAVLLMAAFVFGVHEILVQRAAGQIARQALRHGLGEGIAVTVDQLSGADSVRIGRSLFAGLLGLLLAIALLVAPALASGIISSEREKGTLELLVTAPISTLGLVLGKLVGSLAYVLLVIAASLPFTCIAFAFGGVGPEDILRAYTLVLAVAFGAAAIGLYLSALFKRTQIATLSAYVVLLGLTAGSMGLHTYLYLNSGPARERQGMGGDVGIQGRERAPRRQAFQPVLWLNPAAAAMDIVCTAMPTVDRACSLSFSIARWKVRVEDPPRDALWPITASGFLALGGILTVLSTQHISTSRRWLRRPGRGRRGPPAAAPPA